MTASGSLGPIRVNPLGLPHSATSTAAQQHGLQHPNHQHQQQQQQLSPMTVPAPKLNGIKRNLFGSPAPGDIAKAIAVEQKRCLEKFNKRFTFISKMNGTDETIESTQNQAPSLIVREQTQYLAKLEQHSDASGRSGENLPITPPSQIYSNVRRSLIRRTAAAPETVQGQHSSNGIATPTSGSSCESGIGSSLPSANRQKPYARQLKITDFHSQRKMTKFNKGLLLQPSAAATAAASINTTSGEREPEQQQQEHEHEVLHLPKAISAYEVEPIDDDDDVVGDDDDDDDQTTVAPPTSTTTDVDASTMEREIIANAVTIKLTSNTSTSAVGSV